MDRDYSKCDVCGEDIGPDKLRITIDNGHIARHTYAHRRHRYVIVELRTAQRHGLADVFGPQIQTRTDAEIEHLGFEFRAGKLKVGWE